MVTAERHFTDAIPAVTKMVEVTPAVPAEEIVVLKMDKDTARLLRSVACNIHWETHPVGEDLWRALAYAGIGPHTGPVRMVGNT